MTDGGKAWSLATEMYFVLRPLIKLLRNFQINWAGPIRGCEWVLWHRYSWLHFLGLSLQRQRETESFHPQASPIILSSPPNARWLRRTNTDRPHYVAGKCQLFSRLLWERLNSHRIAFGIRAAPCKTVCTLGMNVMLVFVQIRSN